MEDVHIYNCECINKMKDIPDKSVNLVVIDPPYNIGKDKAWDSRKTEDYLNFMGSVFSEVSRVLTDNGALYWFHSDLPLISQLMEWLRANSDMTFNSFIILDKGNFRSISWKNPTDENTLRSWFNVCEYCLYYVKSKFNKPSRTGWENVKLDVNNFQPLRKYAYDLLYFIGKTNITDARRSVFREVGGKADHFMRYGSTQWDLCTKETYAELIEKFKINEWAGFREYESLRQEYESLRQEYESLRQEYESLRPVHNLDTEHKNIWQFKRDRGKNFHPCQKPVDILERIIRCSSNEGDTVLDCFMGSGSTGVACMNTGRKFIGIEMDKKYFDIAQARINDAFQNIGSNDEDGSVA